MSVGASVPLVREFHGRWSRGEIAGIPQDQSQKQDQKSARSKSKAADKSVRPTRFVTTGIVRTTLGRARRDRLNPDSVADQPAHDIYSDAGHPVELSTIALQPVNFFAIDQNVMRSFAAHA